MGGAGATGAAGEKRWTSLIGWRPALALIGLIALVVLVRTQAGALPALLDRLRESGPTAGFAFIGIYSIATVAGVPGSLLTLAAGAAFGLLWGTVYTLVGATLGATLAFLVSRYLARRPVERMLERHPRLRAVDSAIEREGAKVVFLLRLSPVFPFNALNYALGVMPVRTRDYVVASAVGMAPGTFLYVYAGHTAGRVAEGVAGSGPSGPAYYALLGAGLVATAAVTVVVTRAARRALSTVVS